MAEIAEQFRLRRRGTPAGVVAWLTIETSAIFDAFGWYVWPSNHVANPRIPWAAPSSVSRRCALFKEFSGTEKTQSTRTRQADTRHTATGHGLVMKRHLPGIGDKLTTDHAL